MLDLDGELRLDMFRKGVYIFLKSVTGVQWGAHSRCMIMLYIV
jgi:hypothetical protein